MATGRLPAVVLATLLIMLDPVFPDDSVPRRVTEGDVIKALLKRDVRRGLPSIDGGPVKMAVGLSLHGITAVNVDQGYLETVGYLSLKWSDHRLRFQYSPPFNNVPYVRLTTSEVWRPDISLYNAAKGGMKSLNTKDEVLVDYNGTVAWFTHVSLNSLCPDLTHDHSQAHCSLKFGSWSYDGASINTTVQTDQDVLADYVPSGQWTVTAASGRRNEVKYDCCPTVYTNVVFNMTVTKNYP